MYSKRVTGIAGLSLVAVCSLFAVSAQATPTLYPQDFNLLSRIKNTTNSNIIADDSDPRTVYVMPPSAGYGSARGLHTITSHVGFCRNMKNLQSQTIEIEDAQHKLRLEMADQIEEIKAFEKKITAAKIELAQYTTSSRLGDLAKIDADLNQAQINLQADYAALETCTNTCDDIQKDIRVQQEVVSTLSRARSQFVAANLTAARIYDQKKALVTSLTEQRDAVTGVYKRLLGELTELDNQVIGLYTTYSGMEGARSAFTFDSQWDQNITALRNANSGFNFVALNTENAKVFPGILGVQGLPATGAVIGFETPGAHSQQNGGIAMPSFPSVINGNAVLSLVGTCPMLHPDWFNIPVGTDATAQKFGMLITYQYPSTMKLSMTAKYNMYKMYQLIKSSGSSGGLFSSRSWSNTEERNFFRDAFKVEWESQDPGNLLSDDQRMAQEREARNDIYARLYALAVPQSPNKSLLVSASAPPKHGALVISDGLMTACPGNIYCVAGSLILMGLDAIFGSSSSSSSYTNIQDIQLEETWSIRKAVLKPGITSYQVQ